MKTGFTIIELVITIFILSLAVVGIFNAFSIITILTSDSSDRLTATYLAQEGMEIVRNIRDQNWLNIDVGVPAGATWLDGLDVCFNGCRTDYSKNQLDPWANNETDYLKIDDGNGFYNLTNGTNTKFKRKIIITHPEDDSGNPIDYILKVVVEVSWNKKATILKSGLEAGTCEDNCIKAEETLYNWYNTPSSDKDILSFGFDKAGESYVINSDAITVTLPNTVNDITNLIAVFTTTGSRVMIGDEEQISGDERFSRDFTNPVEYTVVAGDGTTKTYTVNVIVED